MAGRPQPVDRPIDPALAMERTLALPDVEADPQALEARLDSRAAPLGRPGTKQDSGIRALRGRLRPESFRHLGREVLHVGPAIAVRGDRPAEPDGEDRKAK